tara:strand:+ start:826 stop:1047 length:222 start_codon:yes stop_codon:yes gene_type:complete
MTVLEENISLLSLTIPIIEMIEMMNIEAIDKMQLKIIIFISRLDESSDKSTPSKQRVILFPPRNCTAPSKPPL